MGSLLVVVPVETVCGCAWITGSLIPLAVIIGSIGRSIALKMPKSPGAKRAYPRQQQLLCAIKLLILLKFVHRATAGFCSVLVWF